MTDRELLAELYQFLQGRAFIIADKDSVSDMVKRYKNPPLTLYRRAAMQMTMSEYKRLGELLAQVKERLEIHA